MYPGGLPVSRELATRKVRAATRFVAESCTPYFDTGDLAPGTSSRSASWSSGWSPARPSSTTASARSVRDQLRDPVGAFGLVVNAIVLWNTRYVHAALNHPCGSGYHVRNDDMQRPSPRVHDHINLRGRYQLSASNLPWPASTAARHHHSRRVTATRAVTGGSCSTAVSTAIGPSRGEHSRSAGRWRGQRDRKSTRL